MDPLMAFWIFLIGIIAGVIIGLTLVYRAAISPLHKKIEKLSLSTANGKLTEQFPSFIEKYPYPLENFRYLGTPIDGIQFEDDHIIFVKLKTKKSKTNPVQNKIKKLVEQGKTKWFEFRI